MNPTIETNKLVGYVVISLDGCGYPIKPASNLIYSIQAAAVASREYKDSVGYCNVEKCNIVQFGDDYYIYSIGDILKSEVIKRGEFPDGEVVRAWKISHNKNENYIVSSDGLFNISPINNSANIQGGLHLISNGVNVFLLKHTTPMKMASFKMSRELAVAAALEKLTPEERGLLGLS